MGVMVESMLVSVNSYSCFINGISCWNMFLGGCCRKRRLEGQKRCSHQTAKNQTQISIFHSIGTCERSSSTRWCQKLKVLAPLGQNKDAVLTHGPSVTRARFHIERFFCTM